MSAVAGVSRTYRLPAGFEVTFTAPASLAPGLGTMSAEWTPRVPDAAAMRRIKPAYLQALAEFAGELVAGRPQ